MSEQNIITLPEDAFGEILEHLSLADMYRMRAASPAMRNKIDEALRPKHQQALDVGKRLCRALETPASREAGNALLAYLDAFQRGVRLDYTVKMPAWKRPIREQIVDILKQMSFAQALSLLEIAAKIYLRGDKLDLTKSFIENKKTNSYSSDDLSIPDDSWTEGWAKFKFVMHRGKFPNERAFVIEVSMFKNPKTSEFDIAYIKFCHEYATRDGGTTWFNCHVPMKADAAQQMINLYKSLIEGTDFELRQSTRYFSKGNKLATVSDIFAFVKTVADENTAELGSRLFSHHEMNNVVHKLFENKALFAHTSNVFVLRAAFTDTAIN